MVSRIVARVRSLWRGLRHRADVEAEMREEFLHHVRLRTEDLMRQGLSPQDAARHARLEFGHMEGHKEDARASRGLRVFDSIRFSWLDVKLGVRMLAKYPGLSVVSVLGMSVAIAIGGAGFGFIHSVVYVPLPLDEGDRVVSLQNSDVRNPGSPHRRTLHDFLLWHEELRSVRDLSAFRTEGRSLIVPGGSAGNVRVAEMTATGFRVARVAPVLGRPLLEDDDREGAPPVVVIAHEEWQRRFDGDPEIIGRPVRLDTAVHTVVGVMPEGFRFPFNDRYWVPLRLDPTAHEVGAGPEIRMFGRLADGATLEQAKAELTTIGRRMAAAYPATHEHLRPWIRPYTHPFVGNDGPALAWLIRTFQIGLGLLLVVVSVNVAILVYARTAARTGEIAVRTALGASRRRVVAQLFAEALVLASTAAAIGLTIAGFGSEWIERILTQGNAEQLPFWMDLGLSAPLVAYVTGLAILAAAIVGVGPALRATSRSVQGNLRQLSSGGSRLQLGRTWTALIVVQLAIAVAALPYALYFTGGFLRGVVVSPDYAVDEFVNASLSIGRDGAPATLDSAAYEDALAARFAASVSEMLRRLEAEPEIAGTAFASRYPGTEPNVQFEVEGTGTRSWVWVNDISTDLFEVFDVPILAGRGFFESDAGPGSNAVIVDRVFAEQVLGSGDVLGRRVRQVVRGQNAPGESDSGPWLEIVGVVPAFTPPPPFEPFAPKLYRPLGLTGGPDRTGRPAPGMACRGRCNPSGILHLAVRTRAGAAPATLLGRLRQIGVDVDPALQLRELRTASEAVRQSRHGLLSLALAVAAVAGSVLLLSAAGIHAMMSFIVATRRREIGIRAALGAAPRRVLAGIFGQASAQLGAGVVIGLVLAELVARAAGGGSLLSGEGVLVLMLVAVILLAIGLLAAFGPARRGLAVQPTEALRED